MARLTSKEIGDIVARDMPGFRLAEPAEAEEPAFADAAAKTGASAEAATPDLDALRRKYFGDAAAANPGADNPGHAAPDDNDDDDDDEIVHVVPQDGPDPWDRARRPKSVVFSHREKRVVGYQG